MKFIESIISNVNDVFYGYLLIIVLIGAGLYFTLRTKGAQVSLLPEEIRCVAEKPTEKKGVSSFESLMVSTASRVGTGNIIGVSTALCIGGFGSVFWMWVIALIGGASAFVESTLGQIYKKRGEKGSYGGPAYYIEQGLKLRPLAILFSIILVLTYGVGFNMLASYNLQSTFSGYGFYDEKVTPWIIGGITAALVALCLFGGGKRILKVTGFFVPVMGVIYILAAIVVSVINISSLPAVFGRIFREAFDLTAIFGGFGGSCVMYGIKRGLFSNEAGVGSAPNAAASADVSHPVKQGLVQTLSVFIDTLLVCSATAFMCMCSGVEPTEALSGAPYVQASLAAVFGDAGPIFITVAMVLFAFTTLIGNLYYVNQAWAHLFRREPGKLFLAVYYVIASALVLLGAALSADFLWNLADLLMGLMTVINIPVIILLGRYAFRALADYRKQRKEGKAPTFHANDIDLPHKVDYWD